MNTCILCMRGVSIANVRRDRAAVSKQLRSQVHYFFEHCRRGVSAQGAAKWRAILCIFEQQLHSSTKPDQVVRRF